MRKSRIIFFSILTFVYCVSAQAEQWTTYFAYNNVTQIAMASDRVFAVSDGSLFSVDKQTEMITKYDRQSGLHGTGINCIHYDSIGNQLIIAYGDGKIDILSPRGNTYISELYNKDMTQRKDIYNVTIKGRTAYLSTHYGVQTMDLRENKLVDSYWLRPGGQETPIQDILVMSDSIFAFASDSLYCASLADNLVDYTYWKREKRSARISPDATKGKRYVDGNNTWSAGGSLGITRVTPTETINYKPDGPLVNIPYRITATKDGVWVLQGGRWASQFRRKGCVMHFDGTSWVNIDNQNIQTKTGNPARDFMNVAIDPHNKHHYFVTSYGTGLYEFDHDTLVKQYLPGEDNTLNSAIPNNPKDYTSIDFATYDSNDNLWMISGAGQDRQVQCIDTAGIWHAIDLREQTALIPLYTPGGFIIDYVHHNLKWIATPRYNTFLCLLDDNGTPFDDSDDHAIRRSQWTNQLGQTFMPGFIYAMMQDLNGRIWIGTDFGAAYIDTAGDYFTSDAIVQPYILDRNGETPITSLVIKAICQTPDGKIWIGTENLGIYVLNSAATEIIAQYTTENSAMPSNSILSLAADENGLVWIGTENGLVSFKPDEDPSGINYPYNQEEKNLDQGSMQRWKLHLSYSNATELASTPSHIYAIGNHSLFSLNRADETLEYWSKATGLNGTSVAHIAYDASSQNLIVAYEDGRIDLINEDGSIQQMPEISQKAGSMSVAINSITVGSKFTYLAMPFGIIAINPRKAEVTDTYYIGSEAAAVDVLRIVEKGDSLYAFTYDRIYSAALTDNLVDYAFWHQLPITTENLQNAVVHEDKLYSLQHDSLYCLDGNTWHLVLAQPVDWMHVSEGQLLLCTEEHILYRLSDNHQLIGLCDSYYINDAIYSQGVYWLAEKEQGLIRLSQNGNDFFRTEGPMNNFGYKLQIAHNRLYVAPGGRWASPYGRQSGLSIYDGSKWIGIPWQDTWYYTDHDIRDVVSYAVDVNDPGHFYTATYSTGVFEFRNYKAVSHYDSINSTLRSAVPTVSDYYFTFADGSIIDEQNNMWVMNSTEIGKPLHVLTPNGSWHALRMRHNGDDIRFTTPTGIWIDRRKSQYKWMMDQRANPRLILFDDGGTPTNNGDDRCMARNTFVDQNGNTLTPGFFYSFAQDHSNRIWIGTEKGIILIPSSVDFFTSNACRRIIIPRNDGTGLGDYLLGEEQINCMAVDGGNRLWIGTANSGLYVMEDDTITVAHFTESNSLLPSNYILSIAIMPETGEVFVGTDRGIASYRSDASEPRKDMSNVYAYPNPVRPNYGGMISITGLMDNTVVNIVDAGGNLVCKTKSHGGTAVWDGKLPDGRRATPGVYTALCNANGGHAVVKILVIR